MSTAQAHTAASPSVRHPVEISVVAPMHNEELCVDEFLRRTDAAMRASGMSYEIIVVSDGSTDRTEQLLRDAMAGELMGGGPGAAPSPVAP